MSKTKQIAIDVNAWNILNQVKKELNKTGRSVSHSDVIRYLKESRSGLVDPSTGRLVE